MKKEDFEGTVEKWLSEYDEKVRKEFETRFRRFEKYTKKTGAQLLYEAVKNRDDPIRRDDVASLLYQFGRDMLDGKVPQRARGYKTEGKLIQKPYSQKSVEVILGSIRAFFSRYDVNVKLKEFKRKDARMRHPRPATTKYFFTGEDLGKIFEMANARDKSVLCIGLLGQDESTTASLKIEDILDKLSGEKVELVKTVRQKTNTDSILMLTPECQGILKLYIDSLGRSEGWLFPGYQDDHIEAVECNRILKTLVKAANIKNGEERVTFHCLRAWFSTILKNLGVDPDIVNLLQGHQVSYDQAYLLKVERAVSQPAVLEELRIKGAMEIQRQRDQLAKDVEELKATVGALLAAQLKPGQTRDAILAQAEGRKTLYKKLAKAGYVIGDES